MNDNEQPRKDALVKPRVLRLRHVTKQDRIKAKYGIRRLQCLQGRNDEGEHRSSK